MGRLAFATWSVAMSGLLFACEMAEPQDSPPVTAQQPGADLALGHGGGGVRAVNEYLRRYGYFPNDETGAPVSHLAAGGVAGAGAGRPL